MLSNNYVTLKEVNHFSRCALDYLKSAFGHFGDTFSHLFLLPPDFLLKPRLLFWTNVVLFIELKGCESWVNFLRDRYVLNVSTWHSPFHDYNVLILIIFSNLEWRNFFRI